MNHYAPEREMCPPFAKGSQCPHAERHIRVRRSIRSVLPGILFGMILTGIVLALSIDAPSALALRLELPIFGQPTELVLPVALLIMVVTIIRPLILMKDARHELRCEKIRSTTGIYSLKKVEVEIPFADILGVKYTQSILQRIVGVGDVIAWTSIAARPEVVMRGVYDPQSVVDLIGLRVKEVINEGHHRLETRRVS